MQYNLVSKTKNMLLLFDNQLFWLWLIIQLKLAALYSAGMAFTLYFIVRFTQSIHSDVQNVCLLYRRVCLLSIPAEHLVSINKITTLPQMHIYLYMPIWYTVLAQYQYDVKEFIMNSLEYLVHCIRYVLRVVFFSIVHKAYRSCLLCHTGYKENISFDLLLTGFIFRTINNAYNLITNYASTLGCICKYRNCRIS